MIVKKYAIYKIVMTSFIKNLNIHSNDLNCDEISFKFNSILENGSICKYIPKSTLIIKLSDDDNSEFFDTELDAIKSLELNAFTNDIEMDNFQTRITILPIYVNVVDAQEIRRLKIKDILQDGGKE
jgi:hypothetical protein